MVLCVLIAIVGATTAAADPTTRPGDTSAAAKQAQNHFKQGKAYLDNQLYDDAIRELDTAYKLYPLPAMLFNIAQAYRLKGDDEQALVYYQQFVDAAPDDPAADEARTHIAYLTKEKEQKAEAERKAKAEQDRLAAEAEAHRQAEVAAAAERERQRVEAERRRVEQEKLDAERRVREAEAQRRFAAQQAREREEAAWNAARDARAKTRGKGYLLAGAGIGLGGLSIAFAVLGNNENDQIQKGGLATGSKISDAASNGHLFNIGGYTCGVLGVIGLAIGVPIVATHLDRGPFHGQVEVVPTVGAGGAPGVSLMGAF